MTVLEAYRLFKSEFPDIKIGKSLFAEHRSKYVILMSDLPQNVCLCRYHENMSLMLMNE